MERLEIEPRSELKRRLRASGLLIASQDLSNGNKADYWDESSVYSFSPSEVESLISKTKEVIPMVREATRYILLGNMGNLNIPTPVFNLARRSFEEEHVELFTRYDFAYLGNNDFRLINIESEAPRYMIEASQSQRVWLNDKMKYEVKTNQVSQVNVISDLTIKAFKALREQSKYGVLHITNAPDLRNEDWTTAAFIQGVASIAGWQTAAVRAKDIRWNSIKGLWEDTRGNPILALYKQMGWDSLFRMPIGMDAVINSNRLELMLEPAWKIIAGHRTVLPALSELYPDSDIILPHNYGEYEQFGDTFTVATPHQWTLKNRNAVIHNSLYSSWGDKPKDLSQYGKLVYGELQAPQVFIDSNDNKKRYTYTSVFTVGGRIAGIGVIEERKPLLGRYSIFKPHFVQIQSY